MANNLRWMATTLLAAAALAGCMHERAPARTVADGGGLTVSGTATVTGVPDIAKVSLGVESRAATAQVATTETANKMNAVIGALKQAGVADADVQTSRMSVYFQRDVRPPEPQPLPARREGATEEMPAKPEQPSGMYVVSNMVTATIRDLDKAQAIINAAMQAGVNQMHGLNFELSQPEQLQAQARAKAVAQAKQNAEQLAQLLGVKLGRVVAVRDSGNGGGPIMRGAMMAKAESAAAMPVERGEVSAQHTVEVVYELP